MRIQLFDRGTQAGKKLFEVLTHACQHLQIENDPEYIKDMNRVYSLGIQGNTILLVDGEVALVDRYPNQKELENILSDYVR